MAAKYYSLTAAIFLVGIATLSNQAWADIQTPSAGLSYSQKSLSKAGNPAAPAYIVSRQYPNEMTGGYIKVGGGIEYGNFDDLFAKIDALSLLFNAPGDDGSSEPSDAIPEDPASDSKWENLFAENPELEDRLNVIKKRVITTAGILATIKTEGYAKAEARGEMAFVLTEDLFGGTLLFGTSFKGNSKAVGIVDEINFDADIAKEALRLIPVFTGRDPVQELDLSGGISLFYNPANHNGKMVIDNNSLLLIKAAKISDFTLSYSHNALHSENGDLYWGVKPKFYRVSLTNVSTRIGDVTDAEAFFDDIKNASFAYENGFDIDLGLVWAAKNYQVGASISSLIEQTYDFPELDRTLLSSESIAAQLNEHKSYTMERQLKLDGGISTDQRHWSLNVELDVNAVMDPMNDEYQWATLTGAYASSSWWLSSARLGASRNLAGSELSYLNAGVTVMKFINIDAATTLDTISLKGKNLKRGVNISVGVQFDY